MGVAHADRAWPMLEAAAGVHARGCPGEEEWGGRRAGGAEPRVGQQLGAELMAAGAALAAAAAAAAAARPLAILLDLACLAAKLPGVGAASGAAAAAAGVAAGALEAQSEFDEQLLLLRGDLKY